MTPISNAMLSASASTELHRYLNRWLSRLRLQRAVAWSMRGAIAGLLIALATGIVAMLGGRILRSEFLLLVGAAALSGAAIIAVAAYAWPISRLRAARLFDRRFDLRERVSTALELSAQPDSTAAEIARQQLDDTLIAARRVEPQRRLRLRVDRIDSLAAIALAACALFIALKGDVFFQAAEQSRAVQRAIAQEVAQIEAIRKQVESNDNLTAEQRQAIIQQLEEAARQLQQAESIEQATSVLTAAEGQLKALADPQAQAQSQALQAAGRQLSEEEGSPLQSFGKNLAEGDTLAAAEALRNIDTSNLSASEAEALAAQLESAAESLQASTPELAAQLRQAAAALRRGDAQAARQALEQAAQALAATAQQIAQAAAAQSAASQIGEGRQRVIQAGRSAQGNQASQDGQQGDGSGESDQQGQGGNSSGAGRGESDNGGESGREAGSDPIGTNNGAGDGGERGYEQIYAPDRLGGEGEEVTLPGSGEPGDDIVGQGDASPGEDDQSRVPYVDVFAAYAQIARQAIDSGQVPAHLRSLVRDYFSALEP